MPTLSDTCMMVMLPGIESPGLPSEHTPLSAWVLSERTAWGLISCYSKFTLWRTWGGGLVLEHSSLAQAPKLPDVYSLVRNRLTLLLSFLPQKTKSSCKLVCGDQKSLSMSVIFLGRAELSSRGCQ